MSVTLDSVSHSITEVKGERKSPMTAPLVSFASFFLLFLQNQMNLMICKAILVTQITSGGQKSHIMHIRREGERKKAEYKRHRLHLHPVHVTTRSLLLYTAIITTLENDLQNDEPDMLRGEGKEKDRFSRKGSEMLSRNQELDRRPRFSHAPSRFPLMCSADIIVVLIDRWANFPNLSLS